MVEHALVIHFVNVIPGEDDYVFGLLGADGINILIDCVCRSHVPVFTNSLHGRQNLNELADFAAENIPAFPDLAIQR